MNSHANHTKRRDNLELFDLAMRMQERLFTMPVGQRLGYVKDLIDAARSGDTQTRAVLANKMLLHGNSHHLHRLMHRVPGDKTITQCADAYCRKFWGVGVIAVVNGDAPEPPTGEVI
jgi:hypothetical protein